MIDYNVSTKLYEWYAGLNDEVTSPIGSKLLKVVIKVKI